MNPQRGRLGDGSTGVLGCVGGAGDRIDEGASDRKKERRSAGRPSERASELIGGETPVFRWTAGRIWKMFQVKELRTSAQTLIGDKVQFWFVKISESSANVLISKASS